MAMGKPILAPQQVTLDVLAEKYCKGHEHSVRDVQLRVAHALASAEDKDREIWAGYFLQAMEDGFVPAGRVNSAAGTDIKATLINCFVQPMSDSVSQPVDGTVSIYGALQEAAETLRRGGGVGYDFSPLRPYGALVGGTYSRSSGPISYMHVFDASCATIESAGARRGAQMGAIRIDHPDVLRFVHAKDKKGDLTYFNISVAVTDAFMRAVENDGTVELWHEAKPHPDYRPESGFVPFQAQGHSDDHGEGVYCFAPTGSWVYDEVRARVLWDEVMRSTYDHAEPGILFIDKINRENNLWYRETIATTNPCGEQPLPPYACCCLGSINLTKFVDMPFTADASFNLHKFKKAVRAAVRALDNVLDITYWPLQEQRDEAMAKRRIGLGYLGLGDMLIMMGMSYCEQYARDWAANVTQAMRDEAYRASIDLAKDKGAFPALDREKYLESEFAKRLPTDIRQGIFMHGIRNSHLLSIAPTGTITLAFADNASNGIEPAYTWSYTRKKREPDLSWKEYQVEDHAYRLWKVMQPSFAGHMEGLPPEFVDALSISATDHMLMMAAVQPYIDTSISKTVNVPADYPYEDFQDLYLRAWQAGCKGLATYRPNPTLGAVLSATETKPEVTKADPIENLVMSFSTAMLERLKEQEAKGYSGWDDYAHTGVFRAGLSRNLQANDPVDAANFLAMLWHHDADLGFDNEPRPQVQKPEGRPLGVLPSETTKMEYWTVEGRRTLYLSVSYADDGGIDRPVEFFVPAGQGEQQQWVSTAMRLLSMVARSGGSVAKALKNMRSVSWDKGPVRCGAARHADGTKVPRYHDSEVAAIGFVLQEMLQAHGYLDESGEQAYRDEDEVDHEPVALYLHMDEPIVKVRDLGNGLTAHAVQGRGKKCEECGAHEVHKVDGCERCFNCGHVGVCG